MGFRKSILLTKSEKLCYKLRIINKRKMGLKSPMEPIIISEKASIWLEGKLKKNNTRTKLTAKEKELLEGSKEFDDMVRALTG